MKYYALTMPRQYTLKKRALGVAETRRRILAAAMELYQQLGPSNTSMLEVARRADVAPGTVLNHFPGPEALARAVITVLRDELRVPSPAIFDGADGLEERIRRLSRELATFYERSEAWYRVYQAEAGRGSAWDAASEAFYTEMDALIRTALGPLGRDDIAVSLASTVLGPSVSSGLRGHGLDARSAGDLLADLLIPWLAMRSEHAD